MRYNTVYIIYASSIYTPVFLWTGTRLITCLTLQHTTDEKETLILSCSFNEYKSPYTPCLSYNEVLLYINTVLCTLTEYPCPVSHQQCHPSLHQWILWLVRSVCLVPSNSLWDMTSIQGFGGVLLKTWVQPE